MKKEEQILIKNSWDEISYVKEEAAKIFYDKLFELDPSLQTLFKGNMDEQGAKLMEMIGAAVGMLDRLDKLKPIVQELGVRHAKYGVKRTHYDTVGAALIETLKVGLGDCFTKEVEAAWVNVYTLLSSIMLEALDDEQHIEDKESGDAGMKSTDSKLVSGNEKEMGDSNFKKAIDNCLTAMMMIDRDLNITYVNESTMSLLKSCESVFKESWPGFSADREYILGSCIDIFHKNPEHQRRILSDAKNLPYKADITVGDLTIELNISAIMSAAGEYTGCTLEWSDVTDARAQANKAAQLQGAINQSGTPTMMVDRDLNITYYNESTLALLKEHEAVFATQWPEFKATEEFLMGNCIDNFHKKPEHQRKILNDINNLPWQADISVGELTIELNITGITDLKGEHIGCALEWADVTSARAQANKAAQLQGAINQSGTPMMMVDRDLNITYFNESTLALLKEHEAVFAAQWPGFKATEDFLMGNCIDNFHKKPEHQRNILGDINNLPWKADISVGELTIELNITGITDLQGEHIGCALEWADVTAARANQVEVGRLTSVVEGMTTNVMMADKEGNIVYMNPAVKAMLQRRESQLQTVLPSFRVDNVIGTNFDSFHKNPAHQQNLLGDPKNLPYNADIKVAGLEFNLNAMSLKDAHGNHIGSGVQWVDTTEQNDAQRQVEDLIASAARGELDKRIDASSYEGFMVGLCNGINSLLDNVVDPLTSAVEVTQSLANGDLSKTMDGAYDGQFLELAQAINSSMGTLGSMVSEIRNASTNVFSAAREIAQGNNDLSQRTETQAASLEETASAMEELTTTVQQNAENATEATKMASDAMEKASSGGAVVQNAVSAMEEINSSSKKIADIIGVIDEIAFQTNLLALNAAVEAARAGEQGRGFAVVAAEVRNLAQRSAGAAKEIKGLINDSVDAVGKGTKLVDETGQTFEQLVNAVQQVVTMISDIDSASKEQSIGIAEVSESVNNMDEMTQQNAALVEEAAASSKSMEDQAQKLIEQVSFFKADESEMETTNQFQSALSQGAKPSTPRRAAGGQASDEWEEF